LKGADTVSANMISAQGAIVAIGDGSTPEVYTTIGEVVSFGWSKSRDVIDKTAITDTAEVVGGGLARGGELTIEGGLYPSDSGQVDLDDAMTAGTACNFQITASDGTTTRVISAIVTAYSESGAVNEKHSWSATLKITGTPTRSEV